MRGPILALGIMLAAGLGHAADQPVYGPPQEWVKPVEMPKLTSADTATPTRLLLANFQAKFDGTARIGYFEGLTKIQTPQGLSALGNVSIGWNPDIDTLTIHKLQIVRGDQKIDLLAGGHAFTVLRRENNLEMAMLDGTLTAVIQPEGLQVGDVLDLAYTISKNDPVMQGKSEWVTGNILGVPTDRLSVRAVWPKSKTIHWRQTEGLAPTKIVETPEGSELSLEMTSAEPVKGPNGAPLRFFQLGRLEGSEFESWADVSALMSPLYKKATTLAPDSPLKAEAAKIKASSSDAKTQAMAALKLVQDQIRYFFLGMNNGGYIPASAEQTWSRRFGDCKGKTAVLLALLHELGIEAQPALANIMSGDGLNDFLPAIELFDHVLVRATIAGKTYWLDGTRQGDRNLDDIPVPGFHWVLPVQDSGATLVKLVVPPPDKPMLTIDVQLDASNGIDAPASAHATAVYTGDSAILAKLQLAEASKTDLQKFLKDFWKSQFDGIEVAKTDAEYDPSTGEERLSMDGSRTMEWKKYAERPERQFQVDNVALGWKADFDRDPGPNANAPFATNYPFYVKYIETIRLPGKGAGFTTAGTDVDKVVAARQFRRTIKLEDGVVKVEASTKSLAPEFPFADADAAKKELRALFDQTVDVIAPKGLSGGSRIFERPAEKLTNQGLVLLSQGNTDAAIVDFDKAIALDPTWSISYSGRGAAYIGKGEIDKARADFDKALVINPQNTDALDGRGELYVQDGNFAKAIEVLSAAIALKSDDAFALRWRAVSYLKLNNNDKAFADFEVAAKLAPSNDEFDHLRAAALLRRGDTTDALEMLNKYLVKHDRDASAYAIRAAAYEMLHRLDEAKADLSRNIALQPTAAVYLERANLEVTAPDERLADINKATELDPKSPRAFFARARFYQQTGDYVRALTDIERAVALDPANDQLVAFRASLLSESGQYDRAIQEIDKLITKQPANADYLNDRCWFRAISGRDLNIALADCNASIAARALPANHDSRGLVYLKMGRYADSIVDYDEALKTRPDQAASLFGRGVAKLRKGEDTDGNADLSAARKINPKIDAEYASYNIKP